MGRPVIIDDGGSIRIMAFDETQNNMNKKMEDLFDVKQDDPANPGRKQSKHTINEPYSKVYIRGVDQNGGLVENDPNAQTVETILISDDLGQNIEVKVLPSNHLQIKVYSDEVEPIIESQNQNNKVSYTVVNSGRIREVSVNDTPILQSGVHASIVII